MASELRTLLLGYGYAGKTFHAPLLRSTTGLKLTHVASSQAAQVKQQLGIDVTVLADYPAAVQLAEIDLVVIASPNDSHAPLAELALRAGKHVFCEKPLCLTLDELAAIAGNSQLQQFADNTLAREAEHLGINMVATDFSQPLSAASDGPVQGIDEAWQALRKGVDRSLPLAAGIERYLAGLEPDQARATRYAIDGNLIIEACLPLTQLSVASLDEEGVGNEDRFLPGGYSQIIEHLASGLDIRLSQPVSQIDWRDGELRINDERGDFCICTVPLGVIKTLHFLPELPPAQRDALAHLGMGKLEKVVLQFEQRCLPLQYVLVGRRALV